MSARSDLAEEYWFVFPSSKGDANLSMWAHLPHTECPDVLRGNPQLVAAFVERVEVALGKINKECHDQSKSDALHAAWDRHIGALAAGLGIETDILMRLWSGCLSAAKAISPINYWEGPIGFTKRYLVWRNLVFPTCKEDEVYRLGALAAPHFKLFRKERITLKGVPLRTCGDPDFAAWSDIKEFER